MKTVAVILALGDGAKVGVPEAVLEYEKGKSFFRWLSSTFSKAGAQSIGVIRRGAEQVKEQHPDALLVEEDGESALKAGLREALEQGAETVIVHPVERPAVRASTIDKLLHSMDGAEGVVPDFEGAPGQPVILSRRAAERILSDNVNDLNALVQRVELRRVPTRDPGVLVNIDSAEAYERILGSKPHAAPPPKRKTRKTAEG